MSNIIKCPICHEMAELRYNENRVYQSRCQNMECRKTVTVTAPSGRVAEELFSKFEKGTALTKLSIPKKIAEQADKTDFDELFQWGKEEFYQWFDHEHDKYKEVIYAYLACKALGVELVEVTDE